MRVIRLIGTQATTFTADLDRVTFPDTIMACTTMLYLMCITIVCDLNSCNMHAYTHHNRVSGQCSEELSAASSEENEEQQEEACDRRQPQPHAQQEDILDTHTCRHIHKKTLLLMLNSNYLSFSHVPFIYSYRLSIGSVCVCVCMYHI